MFEYTTHMKNSEPTSELTHLLHGAPKNSVLESFHVSWVSIQICMCLFLSNVCYATQTGAKVKYESHFLG